MKVWEQKQYRTNLLAWQISCFCSQLFKWCFIGGLKVFLTLFSRFFFFNLLNGNNYQVSICVCFNERYKSRNEVLFWHHFIVFFSILPTNQTFQLIHWEQWLNWHCFCNDSINVEKHYKKQLYKMNDSRQQTLPLINRIVHRRHRIVVMQYVLLRWRKVYVLTGKYIFRKRRVWLTMYFKRILKHIRMYLERHGNACFFLPFSDTNTNRSVK